MSRTVILQNAVLGDVVAITLKVTGGTTIRETAQYTIRDAGGNVVKSGSVSITPNGATTTALLAHVTSVILPLIDTAEGT